MARVSMPAVKLRWAALDSPRARLIIEGALIVVSVALGFAVNEWRQSRADRELASRALRSFLAEVEYNLGILEPQIAAHRKWMEALAETQTADEGRTAYDTLFKSRPGDAANIRPLRRAAWDAAISTGALRLIEYEVAAALSEVYQTQTFLYDNLVRMMSSALYTPSTFDPASRAASVPMMRGLIAEVEGNERFILELYQRHLPAIRVAANAEP